MKKVTLIILLTVMMIAGFSIKVYFFSELKSQNLTVFNHALVITDFNLVSHTGTAITQESLKGRWSLLFFGYTYCPDVCPTTLSLLKRMYKGLPDDLKDTALILVTVDPERDTPEKLQPYLEYFGSEFSGITGELSQIKILSTELHSYFQKVSSGKKIASSQADHYLVDHSANISIINTEGKFQGYLKAPFTVEQLINDYRVLRNNFP